MNQNRKQMPHYCHRQKSDSRIKPDGAITIRNFLNNNENPDNLPQYAAMPELPWEHTFQPWEYDFKYEYLNGNEKKYWNLDEEEDPIKRILKYKHDDNEFDCDGSGEYGCDLTREIYRKLWGWNDGKKQRYGTMGSNPWLAVGPDTMNSFMTVFIQFSKETWNKGVKNFSAKKLYEQLVEKKGCSLETYLKDLQNSDIIKYPDMAGLWKSFAVFTHSVGNFILVPAGFNGKRGISSVIHDFWDLSLVYLKRRIKETTWLSEANAFTKYINVFFLWDYVSNTDGATDYRVKSLLSENFSNGDAEYNDRHIGVSEGDSTMPALGEIHTFLKNCIWAIKRRGIFMTAMLWLEVAMGSEKYGELRNQVFAVDRLYSGYGEVIKYIEDAIKEPIENAVERIQIEKNVKENVRKKAKAALAELKN